MQGWEHFQKRAQWNCHSVRLPPSLKLFSGYSTCSEPLETRKAADTTTQPAQKIDNMTNSMTTKHTHMLLAEKKMEEIERKNARLGTLPGESPVECHSVRFPPSLKLFSGYSTCSEPLETRKAADTTTQPAQKMHKTWQIQWQPNIHTCFLLKRRWKK